jgi:iron-sulfur cluster repair protein YtfE (RIC family)
MADVTRMLEQDHREAEGLLAQIKDGSGGARADLVAKLAGALILHMHVEETLVFPAIARQVYGGEHMVEQATSGHQRVRKALAEVELRSPHEPGFDVALEMLEADIGYQVRDEEAAVFPKFREFASPKNLDELATQAAAAKQANPA